MSRRSPGEGSVYQRSDGKWCGAIQCAGKRKVVYGKTRSEVVSKLRALSAEVRDTRSLSSSGRTTLSDFLTQWLQQSHEHRRPKTYVDYSIMARKHIASILGTSQLSRITPVHLVHLYGSLGKSLSPRRVRMVHDLLHKVFEDARRWGLLPMNPADMVDAPKRQNTEPTIWNPDQAAKFVEAVQQGKVGTYGPLLGFLLASGCRVGEGVGLRWSDVDFELSAVRITRQITEVSGVPTELLPKTKAGVRTVVIPTCGMRLLHRQRAQVATWQLQVGEQWKGNDRVFVSQTGNVPSFSNVRRAFDGACIREGLPKIRIHDLRHLHLSILTMNVVPVKVARARAGHSSPVVTMRVYQHIIGDPNRQAAQVLESALAAG